MKSKVWPSFWRDPELEEQPVEVKLTVLWLITNPEVNLIGLQRRSERRFGFETGLDRGWLEKALGALPSFAWAEGDLILVRNFIRLQYGDGDELKLVANNIGAGVLRAMEGLPKGLRGLAEKEYPLLAEALGKGLARASSAERQRWVSEALGKGLARASTVGVKAVVNGTKVDGVGGSLESLPSPTEGVGKDKGISTSKGLGEGRGGVGEDRDCGAVWPTVEEVAGAGKRALCGVIPEGYCRHFHRTMEKNASWLNRNGQLKRWGMILEDWWGKDKAAFEAGTHEASPNFIKKPAPAGAGGKKPGWVEERELRAAIEGHVANREGSNFRPGAVTEVEKEDLRGLRARLEALKKGGAA